jgi:hypothetical protein
MTAIPVQTARADMTAPAWSEGTIRLARCKKNDAEPVAAPTETRREVSSTAALTVASVKAQMAAPVFGGLRITPSAEPAGARPRRVRRERKRCRALDNRLSTVPTGQPSRRATSS